MAVYGVSLFSKQLQEFYISNAIRPSCMLQPVGRTVILPWLQGTHTTDSLSHLEVRGT